jgi:hypothetical protein
MPGYGIEPAPGGKGLLPWAWAVDRLAHSRDYWLATAWPEGRPHITPVWGVWMDDAVWFSSSPSSRKARNLANEPRCAVTTDDPLEPVIVDGEAHRVTAPGEIERYAAATAAKYEADYGVDFYASNALFRVRPRTVIGLEEANFTGSPTRWRFGADG